jgi:hypothetical protein
VTYGPKFGPTHYRVLSALAHLRADDTIGDKVDELRVALSAMEAGEKTRQDPPPGGLAALIPEPDEEVLARARAALGGV